MLDLERVDQIELRARLEEATEAALTLADELVLKEEQPFVDILGRDQVADYREARLLMRRLRTAMRLDVGVRG